MFTLLKCTVEDIDLAVSSQLLGVSEGSGWSGKFIKGGDGLDWSDSSSLRALGWMTVAVAY